MSLGKTLCLALEAGGADDGMADEKGIKDVVMVWVKSPNVISYASQVFEKYAVCLLLMVDGSAAYILQTHKTVHYGHLNEMVENIERVDKCIGDSIMQEVLVKQFSQLKLTERGGIDTDQLGGIYVEIPS
ncbi:MAG: hypothetical protein KAJ03_12665 [Gammaproteobacteria bacterium]|nr:hypothetical protein [Gammaproteobacteria bacterium]